MSIESPKESEISEALTVNNCWEQHHLIERLKGHPNLRSLFIDGIVHRTNEEIFSILRTCRQLETFVIDSGQCSARIPENQDEDINDYIMNVQFHEEFVKVAENPRIKMEIRNEGESIGFVTKEEIIWRNKLLHWVGYEAAKSQSNLNLLDLASIPEGTKAKHKQPLHLIFNYLDLNSLYAFCGASKQCKQLVHNYIFQRCIHIEHPKQRLRQRSLQRGRLFLTDEFSMNYNALRLFGKCITNLDVSLLNYRTCRLEKAFEKYFKKLSILCLRTRYRTDPHNFIFPTIRHYVFYGYGRGPEYRFFCDLYLLAKKCPDLEILELRTPTGLYTSEPRKQYKFRNLQRIKINPHDESTVQFAEKYLENTIAVIEIVGLK